jgi:hypothetical protein
MMVRVLWHICSVENCEASRDSRCWGKALQTRLLPVNSFVSGGLYVGEVWSVVCGPYEGYIQSQLYFSSVQELQLEGASQQAQKPLVMKGITPLKATTKLCSEDHD